MGEFFFWSIVELQIYLSKSFIMDLKIWRYLANMQVFYYVISTVNFICLIGYSKLPITSRFYSCHIHTMCMKLNCGISAKKKKIWQKVIKNRKSNDLQHLLTDPSLWYILFFHQLDRTIAFPPPLSRNVPSCVKKKKFYVRKKKQCFIV